MRSPIQLVSDGVGHRKRPPNGLADLASQSVGDYGPQFLADQLNGFEFAKPYPFDFAGTLWFRVLKLVEAFNAEIGEDSF